MIRTIGGAAAAVAVLGMTVPAEAGDRKPRHHRHHDEDKVTAGDVVAGAVLIGAIALLAGKKKKPPVEPEPVAFAEPLPTAFTQDEVVDACARAAEGEGARLARVVQTDRIVATDPAGEGWFARGFVTLRDSYREGASATKRGFRCSIAAGMPRVTFDGEELAAVATP